MVCYRLGLAKGFQQSALGILNTGNDRSLAFAFNFYIDKDIGSLFRDIGIVQEDASASRLLAFDGIGDMDGRLADEPHIAIHTAMIGKIQLCLLLAGGIALIVAVISLHGNQAFVACFQPQSREVDGDGQIAAQMFLDDTPVDVNPLFAHDGLEVNVYLLARHIGRHHKMLAIPAYALIVAASAGLRGL